jgi:hypothetical protein
MSNTNKNKNNTNIVINDPNEKINEELQYYKKKADVLEENLKEITANDLKNKKSKILSYFENDNYDERYKLNSYNNIPFDYDSIIGNSVNGLSSSINIKKKTLTPISRSIASTPSKNTKY